MIMKKILLFLTLGMIFFASCKKAEVAQQLGESGYSLLKIKDFGGISGNGFSNSILTFDPTSSSDFRNFSVELSRFQAYDHDIYVTVSLDTNLVAAYNATKSLAADKFNVLPASAYTFSPQKLTIKAYQIISEEGEIEFHPDMIDGSKNFMLPLKITKIENASSELVAASGTSIAYLHIIGNPAAGNYSVVGTRYNCTVTGDQGYNGGPIPSNFTTAAIPTSKFLAPVTPTQLTTYIANLGAGTDRDYYFSFNPLASGIQNIDVTLTPSFAAGVSNVRWLKKEYDPSTKKITLLWTYNNLPGGVGNDRIISEVMTKL